MCTTLPPGRYRWTRTGDDLTFSLVDDGMCRAGRVLHGRRLAAGPGKPGAALKSVVFVADSRASPVTPMRDGMPPKIRIANLLLATAIAACQPVSQPTAAPVV